MDEHNKLVHTIIYSKDVVLEKALNAASFIVKDLATPKSVLRITSLGNNKFKLELLDDKLNLVKAYNQISLETIKLALKPLFKNAKSTSESSILQNFRKKAGIADEEDVPKWNLESMEVVEESENQILLKLSSSQDNIFAKLAKENPDVMKLYDAIEDDKIGWSSLDTTKIDKESFDSAVAKLPKDIKVDFEGYEDLKFADKE